MATKTALSLLSEFRTRNDLYFIQRGEKKALLLFQRAAQCVPAYRDFLKKNRIKPDLIKTIEEFKNIPPVSKDNYLRVYPRSALFPDGILNKQSWVISTTSGSTGQPYYFFRSDRQDNQYALTAELYLLNNFEINKYSTLYIDGFAMGAWIGGLFTYQAVRTVALSGKYPLTIITPGVIRQEIINAVKNLGEDFEQIIIGGYPPFIKDIIEDGKSAGIRWNKLRVRFIFSAEGFSENFRDYLAKQCQLPNPYLDTLNHYGTVDLGTMAHETPFSILLRRISNKYPELNKSFFGDYQQEPTVCQYVPEHFFFEEENGGLLCTAESGIPLVRYDLKDRGGIILRKQINKQLEKHNININQEISGAGIKNRIWNLPFVHIHERQDFVVKLYGANIYPATFRRVLEDDGFSLKTTGRFTLEITYDADMVQYLIVHTELKPEYFRSKVLAEKLAAAFEKALLSDNSEYRSNWREAPERQRPQVVLWRYGESEHFNRKGKQRWVK